MNECQSALLIPHTAPVVFTAQSKHYFYCRDTICEYVLLNHRVPINPFRMFGYFLGDRVPHAVIRQSNERLMLLTHELWVFGPIANGVWSEILLAKKYKKTIRFFNISTDAAAIHEIPVQLLSFEQELLRALGVSSTDLVKNIIE